MTTERDKRVASDVSLDVCDACGWYRLESGHRCRPAEGVLANDLIALVPGVDAGKLGYGDGQVMFDIGEDFTVRFEVHKDGTFTLRDVHLLDSLTTKQAAMLVLMLKGWKDRPQ